MFIYFSSRTTLRNMYERGRKGLYTNEKFYRIIAFSQDSSNKVATNTIYSFRAIFQIGLQNGGLFNHGQSYNACDFPFSEFCLI